MRIERINDNQIKCTLNRNDLAIRQIKVSELAYGSEKTKGLFQDMIEQAHVEFGFDAMESPVVVEAIPVSLDCIVLMITKVDEPDEIDTDFSAFSNIGEVLKGNPRQGVQNGFLQAAGELFGTKAGVVKPGGAVVKAKEKLSARMFSFGTLSDVLGLAKHSAVAAEFDSSLYKSPERRFFLVIYRGNKKINDFGSVCANALEYGKKEPFNPARKAYMDEHYERIIGEDALAKLSVL